MGIFSGILAGGATELVKTIGTVFDSLFTSKEEKAQAELAKLQIMLAAQQATSQLEADLDKAYLADAANLREQIKLEISSQDWWVRRARSMPIWLGGLILGFNLLIFPLMQIAHNLFAEAPVEIATLPLPTEFWYLYSGLTLGYGVLRTIDKRGKNGLTTPS